MNADCPVLSDDDKKKVANYKQMLKVGVGGIHHVLGGIGQQRGRDGVDETLYEESSGTEDIVGCGEDIGSGWRWRTEL